MKYTIGIIIGILVAVTVFHVWYLYKLNTRITAVESFAIQVAQIINQANQTQK